MENKKINLVSTKYISNQINSLESYVTSEDDFILGLKKYAEILTYPLNDHINCKCDWYELVNGIMGCSKCGIILPF